MVSGLDDIKAVEDLLRGSGVSITPVEPAAETGTDLQTADGRFTIEPARNIDRRETAVTLYRTDTAEPIPTDLNEVVKRLRKRFPARGDFALTYPQLAGRLAFTIGIKGADGVLRAPAPLLDIASKGDLCWLNPESPHFESTRSLGIRSICRYSGLWSPIRLENHIKVKHEGVWPQHERAEEQRQRREDRDARTASDARIAELVELALANRMRESRSTPDETTTKAGFTSVCPQCNASFTKTTQRDVDSAVRLHMRACKT